MKKLFAVLCAALVAAGCEKDKDAATNEPITPLGANAVVRRSSQEMDQLVKAWAEWTQGRSVLVSPVSDPDGNRQYDAQPFASDVFLLAGAFADDFDPRPALRKVTIDLQRYTHVLLPIINLTVWYDACDPAFAPAPGQEAEAFFKPIRTDAFEQGDNSLSLVLDKTPVISAANQDQFRITSGVWQFRLDPSQNNGCTAEKSTVIIDGYWALVKLTPGVHTIDFAGRFLLEQSGGFKAANRVSYTIEAR